MDVITPTQCNTDSTPVLHEIENDYWAGMFEALTRLEQNEDFRKVILEGYFKNKAINSVSVLASPMIKGSGKRPDVMEELIAISQLQHFFIMVKDLGSMPADDEDDTEA